MIKKMFLLILTCLISLNSNALILNWEVDNDEGWLYHQRISYAQLVAVSSDESNTFYSWMMDMDETGIFVSPLYTDDFGKDHFWSELNLEEYLTVDPKNNADYSIGYMSEFGFNGDPDDENAQPVYFDFSDYAFYFRMLNEDGDELARTSALHWANTEPVGWENLYEQYIFDAAHLRPGVWYVGVPEPGVVSFILLGFCVLLTLRKVS